jgi:hypothetical protein
MKHDRMETVGPLEVMEFDGDEDVDCADQTVKAVGRYRDPIVRAPGADVGPTVELTGTKKQVGMERDLSVHVAGAAVAPIGDRDEEGGRDVRETEAIAGEGGE